MKEKIIENGIEYVKSGDYYIPNLKAPEGTYNIGRYGKLHSIFIKENRPAFYSMKMLNGTWLAYLEEIDTSAKEMVDKLIKDMAFKQGITEELKVKDQMAWVGAMNNIRHSAEEIVCKDLLFRWNNKTKFCISKHGICTPTKALVRTFVLKPEW